MKLRQICEKNQNKLKLQMSNYSNHMVHSYETRNRNNCYIPCRSSRLGQYSLSFQGPKIWNSIDNKTKDTKSVFSFKKCIKQKFLSQQDNDSSGRKFTN